MVRFVYCILLTLSLSAATFLFFIKHNVMVIERSIAQLTLKKSAQLKELHLLQSEWSVLSRPARVDGLVKTLLPALQPLKKSQIQKCPS